MTNLKLPVMNHGNLTRLVGERYEKRIAHNTTATAYEGFVSISYHGNHIANTYERGAVYLNTAGWATQTTVTRLNRILTDSLPNTPYRVAIRDFAVCLIDTRDKKARHYFRDITIYSNDLFILSFDQLLTRELVGA